MYSIGIIGYGNIGTWHARRIAKLDGFSINGIYDIDSEQKVIANKDGFQWYDSLESFFNTPDIRTVIIATPNNTHRDLSIAAMRAGKRVICEKPAALNAEELKDMISVSRETGMQFSIHQNRRWDKDYVMLNAALQNGTIGTPFFIDSRVQAFNGIWSKWRTEKAYGGGMLYDWGVHLIDQLMDMNKSTVVDVYAHLLSVHYPEIDDNFKLMLRFSNGMSALVEVESYTCIPLPRWQVCGTEGTIQIQRFEGDGKVVKPDIWDNSWQENVVFESSGPTRTMAKRPNDMSVTYPLEEILVDSCDYYRNFSKADMGIEELRVKPEECLRVMNVIDAAFLSAKECKSISVNI